MWSRNLQVVRHLSRSGAIYFAALVALAATPAIAAVSLSEAPAERATAVSGVAPVLTQPSDMSVAAGGTVDQEIHASDGDGNPLTFLKSSGPGFMTVSTTDPGSGNAVGNIHLAPGLSEAGAMTATVTAFDGALSDSRSFSISVQPTPVAPVLTQPADMTVNGGDTQTQTLYASDANGDPLGFYLVSGPAYVTVSTTDPGGGTALGEIVVAPGFPVSGTVTATVGVSDGSLTAQKQITIVVNDMNAPPALAQPSDMTLHSGEVANQQLTASDANGEPLTFAMVSGPAYMTVTTLDAPRGIGNIHLTPGTTDLGTAIGEVRATDGVLSDQKTFGITVMSAPARAPVLDEISPMTVAAGATADQGIYASDADNDILTFSKASGPAYMTVETTYQDPGYGEGNVHLAPGTTDSGAAIGEVRVTDGVLADQKAFDITVRTDAAPVLRGISPMSVPAGSTADQTLYATDEDGDVLTFAKASGPPYMTVSNTGQDAGTFLGNLHLSPGTGDAGSASGTVRVSDGMLSADGLVSIEVLPPIGFPTPCPADAFNSTFIPVGVGLFGVQTADLNGDGVLDLISEGSQGVVVLLGVGDGSFGASPLILRAGTDSFSGTVADFNGDGIPDLAVSDFSSDNISVFLGNGSGGFGPKRDVPMGGYPRSLSIAASDLNRDGKLDLVVTRPNSASVTVLRGIGDGTFGAGTSVDVGGSPWGLVVSDMNGDGATDVIVSVLGNNYVSVLLNNGAGELTSRTDYPVGLSPVGVAVGDLNGDGKADVVAGSADYDYVSVLLGKGNGSLWPRRDFPTNDRPALITIADLNGDGFPDVATANQNSNDLSILLGNGTGALGPHTDFPAGRLPYGIAAGDFDNDLRTDLVVGTSVGSFSILLNGCAPPRDRPPVVHAPNTLTSAEGTPISFTITAGDPDGPAITSLTASFAAFPLGHNATFAANASNTGGTFSWTPTFQDARPTAYLVTFTATNVLSDTTGTRITVTNVNRGPTAGAGGPYAAFAGSPLTLNGTGSSDSDGDVLTFSWAFGDGSTGDGVSPVHTYAVVGLYGIALTVSDGSISDIATTTAKVGGLLGARAFTTGGNRTIRLGAGKPQWCANVEPVGNSYSNVAVDLTTIVMKSEGTGSVSQIRAIGDKSSISGDHDGNGIEEIEACFSKGDLRLLFSNLRGNNTVTVTIEGSMFAGGVFRAQVDVNVAASGGKLAASVSPNPLNPSATLTFTTAKAGFARVDLFDVRGRLVRSLVQEQSLPPGYHDVRIDGRDDHGGRLATGVYLYRIRTAEGDETGQLTVLK